MFTGIITDVGSIRTSEQRGDLRLVISCAYDMDTVAIGASIACSGVCLTVVDKGDGWFAIDASAETVSRTAAGMWEQGTRLNLERALKVGDELGGHIVTGHVDGVGQIVASETIGDSWKVTVAAPSSLAAYIAAKGSITVDGVSLTAFGLQRDSFQVAVIPHTAAVTTLGVRRPGDKVNIEMDVLAKHVDRLMTARGKKRRMLAWWRK